MKDEQQPKSRFENVRPLGKKAEHILDLRKRIEKEEQKIEELRGMRMKATDKERPEIQFLIDAHRKTIVALEQDIERRAKNAP